MAIAINSEYNLPSTGEKKTLKIEVEIVWYVSRSVDLLNYLQHMQYIAE